MGSIFKQEFFMYRLLILKKKSYLKIYIIEFYTSFPLLLRSLQKEIFYNETESISIVPAVCCSLDLHYLN